MRPRVLLYALPPSGGDFFPISLGYIAASLKAHDIDAVVAEVGQITERTCQEVANFIITYKPLMGFIIANSDPAGIKGIVFMRADALIEIIKLTREARIEPEVFTLYGLPGQSTESCLKTLDFLKRLGIKISGNSAGQQLYLFFGTDIAKAPERYGIRLLKKRRPLYLSPGADFVTEHMKRRDIGTVVKAYKAMRPRNVRKGACIS